MHCRCSSVALACCRAHREAAAKRDAEKKAAYAARGDSGYKFIPFSVESLRRLGAPALAFIMRLSRKASAASAGTFLSRHFVEGVLQDIAVILARYNACMENAVVAHVMRPASCVTSETWHDSQ